LPFIINLIEFTPFYFSGALAKIELYNSLLKTGTLILPLHTIFKTTLILIYLILQLYILYKYKPQNISGNKSQRSLIAWFTIFLSEQAILLVGLFINIISGFKLFADPYTFAILVESFYVYSATIALLFFPELLYGKTNDKKNPEIVPKEKYLHSKLSDDNKLNILNDLAAYLESESKPFLNPRLSLVEVAKLLKVTPQQLSQVVNEKTNLNFNNYINTFRIEKAKEILLSQTYNKLTIDSIAEMAGFQSKSPFYQAFKKHTGMTPKEYVSKLSV
jgi:AraC-like DNA-binding protein